MSSILEEPFLLQLGSDCLTIDPLDWLIKKGQKNNLDERWTKRILKLKLLT